MIEKLRQRDADLDLLRARLADTERRQRDRSREVDKLGRENDEMRRQLESLTAISYRVDQSDTMMMVGGNGSAENQKYQDNFKLVGEQLEKLKEQLVNTQNTSRQQQHSRQGSDMMSQSFNFQGNQIAAQYKTFLNEHSTTNSMQGGTNLNTSGVHMTHKREKSRNQDEVIMSASSLSNYSSQQQKTATKTRQSMIIPGTTGKKQQPQQQLNMSSNKYANDISTLSVGGTSQNSATSGFINNKRPSVKSMSGAGFMQSSNFRASAANMQKNRFSIK